MSEATGAVDLTVRPAHKGDDGRGIARLPAAVQAELGIVTGEPVLVEGDGIAVATVWPADDDADVVRIDGDTRAQAGTTVGETVAVSRADVEPAALVRLRGEQATGPPESGVLRALEDRVVRPGTRVRLPGLGRFDVTAATPDGPVRITADTDVTVSATDTASTEAEGDERTPESRDLGTTYEDIGGLDDELDRVREMIELPLADPTQFERLGIDPPSGVLLHGPPGTGKTLIAKAVATEVDAGFEVISGPEIVSKYKGESEQRLREAFETAAEDAPAIVFIDEIDAIAGTRGGDDMENRIVAQLLTLMDGLEATEPVVVIGATNRVDAVDPALRRGGRFDREIEIGVPDEAGRREILDVHTRSAPLADDVDLDAIAETTHGFVGADLAALVREAAIHALQADRDPLEIRDGDFQRARRAVEPSAMREYVAEQPSVTFADVGGLSEAKQQLREAVQWPLSYGPLFEAAGTDPPAGVLLHGPSGTGKTLLARAVGGESGINFLQVDGPGLLDRYVGESEAAVRELFERARRTAPSIVFLDEIDAIAARRGDAIEVTERVVSQLLAELDRAAAHPTLAVVAATNRREALDDALLRPGRLERHVAVDPPDEADRRAILAVHTEDAPLADDVDLADFATRTSGFTGADLEALVRAASLRAIRDVAETVEPAEAATAADEVTITRADFEAAFADLDASGTTA